MEKHTEPNSVAVTRERRLVELKDRLSQNGDVPLPSPPGGADHVSNDSLSMPPPTSLPILHVPPVESTDASASLTDFTARKAVESSVGKSVKGSDAIAVDMKRPFHNIGGIKSSEVNANDEGFPTITNGSVDGAGDSVPTKKKTPIVDLQDSGEPATATIADPDATSDSQTSTVNTANGDACTPSKRKRHNIRDPIVLEAKENGDAPATPKKKKDNNTLMVTADTLVEYKWPANDKTSENFMIQEQVSEFLEILSFKRKYPDLERRTVEKDERTYLLETFPLFTCSHFDLGLTALKSEQLHDLMLKDYPVKFKEFAAILRKRDHSKQTDVNKGVYLLKYDTLKLQEYTKTASKSASEFNSFLMKERREERMAYFDLQTSEVHYPSNRWRKPTRQETKVGQYPVALIAGQYQDHVKRYSPLELLHMPLSSARVVRPAPRVDPVDPALQQQRTITPPTATQPNIQRSLSPLPMMIKTEQSDTTTDSDLPLKPSPTQPLRRKLLTRSRRNAALESPTTKRKVRSDKGQSRTKANSNTPGATFPSSLPSSAGSRLKGAAGESRFLYPRIPCNVCMRTAENKVEDLVMCAECERLAHPSCLELTNEMVPVIATYKWQCMECKLCFKCRAPHDEDKMMFCDHCDRGYHTYCVGVASIPVGRWNCPHCVDTDKPKPVDVIRKTHEK